MLSGATVVVDTGVVVAEPDAVLFEDVDALVELAAASDDAAPMTGTD
jgi:hypothetical protein